MSFGELQVSGDVRGDFKCTWTIEGFSSIDPRVGDCHKSEVFQLENGKELHLAIYPGGQREYEYEREYVSCLIYGVHCETVPKWNYRISLHNSDGVELFRGMLNRWIGHPQGALGNSENIDFENIAPQLVEDVLVVILEATYEANNVEEVFDISGKKKIFPLQNLSDHWLELWTSERNTDCVIFVGEQHIPVHLLVVRTRSKLFEHETTDESPRRVDITDFDVGTLKSLVEFIYTGNVREMSSDLAVGLLPACDKYEMNNLKSYCTNYVMSVINNANACQILARAYILKAEGLRSLVLEYIFENLSEDDFEAQREFFNTKPDLFWVVFKRFVKAKKNHLKKMFNNYLR